MFNTLCWLNFFFFFFLCITLHTLKVLPSSKLPPNKWNLFNKLEYNQKWFLTRGGGGGEVASFWISSDKRRQSNFWFLLIRGRGGLQTFLADIICEQFLIWYMNILYKKKKKKKKKNKKKLLGIFYIKKKLLGIFTKVIQRFTLGMGGLGK